MLLLDTIDASVGKGTKLERRILKGLTLEVKPGESVIVIGSNGAGKSTLLNVISGLIQPDSGKVVLLGTDITETSPIERAKNIATVMQDPKLGTMENMTLFENMAFALKRGQKRGLHLFSRKESVLLFKEKLKMINMGLENRLYELVRYLSGGQRQIVSIIMAMLQPSNLLLLDEITAALDPGSSEAIMALTYTMIKEKNLTSIMITHNMAHAIRYGDRLLLLKGGRFIKAYEGLAKSQLKPGALADELGDM